MTIQLPPTMTHQNHSAGLPSIVASSVGKVGFLWITGVYAGYNHAYNTSNATNKVILSQLFKDGHFDQVFCARDILTPQGWPCMLILTRTSLLFHLWV